MSLNGLVPVVAAALTIPTNGTVVVELLPVLCRCRFRRKAHGLALAVSGLGLSRPLGNSAGGLRSTIAHPGMPGLTELLNPGWTRARQAFKKNMIQV